MNNVYYPPVGIAHVLSGIEDIIKNRILDKKMLIVNTSSQPNSSPHIGTITTVMSSFAIAKLMSEILGINSIVLFDQLENAPYKRMIINDIEYTLSLDTVFDNNKSIADKNMEIYTKIFEFIKNESGINYKIRTYKEFQKNPSVRKGLEKIVKDIDFFNKNLNPNSDKIHLRTRCPICGLSDKKGKATTIDSKNLTIKSFCPNHGYFTVKIRNMNDYIDLNTQLRDILKGVLILEDSGKNMHIMCDAADWAGLWDRKIHVESLIRLGYRTIPVRIFTPLILDWSGAKLSKSLYINDNRYNEKYKSILSFDSFNEQYGERGLRALWQEVLDWVSEPRKFFRHYSIEYLYRVLAK